MSYASVLSTSSQGDLGYARVTTALPAVTLANNVASTISNRIYLEDGVYNTLTRVTFTSAGDNTTTIGKLVLRLTNEAGLINEQTLIWNGGVAPVYASGSSTYAYHSTAVVTGATDNEFVASIIWTGAGTAPTATAIISAIKIV